MTGRARCWCKTGKVRYATDRDARAELVARVMDRNRGRSQRQEARVYQCPKCDGFHLTSKPRADEDVTT